MTSKPVHWETFDRCHICHQPRGGRCRDMRYTQRVVWRSQPHWKRPRVKS